MIKNRIFWTCNKIWIANEWIWVITVCKKGVLTPIWKTSYMQIFNRRFSVEMLRYSKVVQDIVFLPLLNRSWTKERYRTPLFCKCTWEMILPQMSKSFYTPAGVHVINYLISRMLRKHGDKVNNNWHFPSGTNSSTDRTIRFKIGQTKVWANFSVLTTPVFFFFPGRIRPSFKRKYECWSFKVGGFTGKWAHGFDLINQWWRLEAVTFKTCNYRQITASID